MSLFSRLSSIPTLFLSTSGLVGIDTYNTQAKLDVNGDALIHGHTVGR